MSKQERTPGSSAPIHEVQANDQNSIQEGYAQIVRRANEQEPGINELLDLYGQFQEGFRLSEEYLQLTQPIVCSSTSNACTPAL
jgi:hypothetical protein